MDKRILCKRMKGFLSLILALGMMLIPSQTVLAANYVVENDEIVVGQTLVVGDFFKANACSFQSSGIWFRVYIDDVEISLSDATYYKNDGFYLTGEQGKVYYVTEYTNTGSVWSDDWVVTLRLSSMSPVTPTQTSKKTSKKTSTSTSTSTSTPTSTHTHSYSWVTVQEPGVGQDGIEEYRCSCGAVAERSVIPATQAAVSGMMDAIQNAPAGGNISFDSGRFYTMSDKIIKKLAERSDVVTEITFEYQGTAYKMTVPAGIDYTAILADEESFYGYFYFAQLVGATIETR